MPPLARGSAVARIRTLILLAAAAFSLPAQILNKNLILNGDAESGPAVKEPTAAKVSSIPNWTTTGGFSVGTYGENGFLSSGDYGCVNRGKQMFYGGPGAQRSTAVQSVDLSGAAV